MTVLDANGVPWCASYIACLGDSIADLTEDMNNILK